MTIKKTLFSIFSCMLISCMTIHAQEAKTLLDKVSTKVKSYNNIHIEFNYTLNNIREDVKQDTRGNITLKEENYVLNMLGVTRIFDGKNIYTIVPEDEEVYEPPASPFVEMKPIAAHTGAMDLAAAKKLLKTVFGYDALRQLQPEVIQNVLKKKDSLAIMPTGSGKSICYQLPALMFDGLTVVVSPLICMVVGCGMWVMTQCVQPGKVSNGYSEDCLFMNIYAPLASLGPLRRSDPDDRLARAGPPRRRPLHGRRGRRMDRTRAGRRLVPQSGANSAVKCRIIGGSLVIFRPRRLSFVAASSSNTSTI